MKRILSLFFIAAMIVAVMAYNALHTKKKLFVYMWSDYIKPQLIEQFQKEHDCWVIVDTYDSNEAMYTKLLLGASGYDIVFPSNYFLDLMSRRGMFLEVEDKFIPNMMNIDRHFLEKRIGLEKSRYGIPYMMTFSGIAWRGNRIDPSSSSWNIFSQSKYAGRMTLLNDMRETIGIALKTLGYSANSTDPDEIEKAKHLIVQQWRPNIAKFESEQYKNGIANGEYLVVHGFNGDCLQIMRENPSVHFSYPVEGSLIAVDYAAIMASSKEPLLARAFLNFLLDPKVAGENMEFTCTRAPNTKARAFLPKDLAQSPVLYPEDNPNITFECIRAIDQAQKHYVEAWDDIKVGRL